MNTTGRILPVVTNGVSNNVSNVNDDKRVFYPINVESFPAEYQEAYAEYRQIVEMLKASREKLDGLFLPVINRLAPPPAGKEATLAFGFGKFQYEYQPIKKKSVTKTAGLVFQPTK